MESLTAPLQTLLSGVTAFLTAHPLVGSWYTAFVRFCSRWWRFSFCSGRFGRC